MYLINTQNFLRYMMLFLLFWAKSGFAYDYKKQEIQGNTVHVLTLDPKLYNLSIVRAEESSGLETVSTMAKRAEADIAINGGFFAQDNHAKGKPSGTLVIQGKIFGIKNKTQALVLIDENKLSIRLENPKRFLGKNRRISMVSGTPLLVKNGEMVRTLSKRSSGFYAEPHARTAIGLKDKGLIMVVMVEHPGITLVDLAQFMEKEGCQYALNLDGGGSSSLCIEGEGQYGWQRPVLDAILFKKK